MHNGFAWASFFLLSFCCLETQMWDDTIQRSNRLWPIDKWSNDRWWAYWLHTEHQCQKNQIIGQPGIPQCPINTPLQKFIFESIKTNTCISLVSRFVCVQTTVSILGHSEQFLNAQREKNNCFSDIMTWNSILQWYFIPWDRNFAMFHIFNAS